MEALQKMDETQLISVVVPIYNLEKILDKSLPSILAQSYSNMEIILVNDGSTDQSGFICDSYAQKDNRVLVIHKENGGLSDARNTGIRRAKGDYLLLIDGDDILHYQMVELLYTALRKHDADVSICELKWVEEKDIAQIQQREEAILDDREWTSEEAFYHLLDYHTYVKFAVACNKLYKRSLFEDISYPLGKIHEDEFVTYRIYDKTRKVVELPNELYYYIQREDSLTHLELSEKRFDKVEAYREMIQYSLDRNLFVPLALDRYFYEWMFFLEGYRITADMEPQRWEHYVAEAKGELKKYSSKLSFLAAIKWKIRYRRL